MKFSLLIISFFLLRTVNGQTETLLQRQEYMKKHHLFVVEIDFKGKNRDKNELMNSNIKLCLNNFWFLSDTVIYIKKSELRKYKKEFSGHVFLNYMYKSSSLEISAFNLTLPKKPEYFNDVAFRIIDDNTSLIDIIEQIRLLQNNVLKGTVLYDGPGINKRILILDEPALSNYHQKFIDDIKKMYPTAYDIVNRKYLEKVIIEKNKNYIYVNRLNLINIDDGTLFRL